MYTASSTAATTAVTPLPSSACLRKATATSALLRRCLLSSFPSPNSLLRSKTPRLLPLSASLSWSLPSPPSPDDDFYNGWAAVEPPSLLINKKKGAGLSRVMIGGIAVSVAALLAVLAYFSLYRQGYKLHFGSPLRTLHGIVSPTESVPDSKSEWKESNEDAAVSEAIPDASVKHVKPENLERVKVLVHMDSTQLEALSVLKRLKIIEDDMKADELCTRREYARWLIRLNSLLERNPKLRIVPSLLLSGSKVAAFDDVGVQDPDYESIQALAEAGILPSKLSARNSISDDLEDKVFCFYPERFISRLDLINWKAQLEYGFFPGITEEMSRAKVEFMDVKVLRSDASPELFIDMLAGDESIFRKVFGQSRRFQPAKPVTKAQAVVALTRGRMAEAISNEISRLEAENSSTQVAMKEIISELLERGDIKRHWEEKIDEERTRGLELEKLYTATLHDLEQEKIVNVETYTEHMKEKAAMDCQRELLSTIKEEVIEMSARFASERVIYVAEQCNTQGLLNKLQTKHEGLIDSKSILEAEIEAIRMLRSWVEDEARKSKARAKVLEEVGRRWKWDNES